MKDRPILFNGAMVRATLAGTKTQTRRIADKMVRHPDLGNLYKPGALVLEKEPQHVIERACPYGQPGDRLWVREAFRLVRTTQGGADGDKIPPSKILDSTRKFEADGATSLPDAWMRVFGKLRPGIHMPRWASRITLEITSVRVERLNDISEADAEAEGLRKFPHKIGFAWAWRDDDMHGHGSAAGAFRDLWKSINGAESLDANPWVWVVEFKRLEACNG